MTETYLVAIDLGKRHFQVCATDETGKTLFNRAFSRQKLQELLDKLPACIECFAVRPCPRSKLLLWCAICWMGLPSGWQGNSPLK